MSMIWRRWLGLLLAGSLTACSGASQPPLPTAIPPAPTLALTAPTAEAPPPRIAISALTPYIHPRAPLTLQVPTGWELRDASLPDEIVLIWRDPTTTGGVLVSVFADPNSYTAAELGGLLERYLVRSYRDLPAFNAGAAVNSNNRMHVDWSYTATQRSLVIPLSGISQIFQHNEQIVIISVVIPTAQRETLAAQVNAILASVQISEQPTTP